MAQVHTRQEIFDRNLDGYIREMLYATNGIKHEIEFNDNIAFSTEYIREKLRIISHTCDALDHDMQLLERREREARKKQLE